MRYYGITDKGLIRETNQDNYVTASNEVGDVFALVCDGIGGGNGGDVASKIAVDYLSEKFSKCNGFESDDDVRDWMNKTIRETNNLIFSKSLLSKQLKGMGTTLVGVLITKSAKYIINIGDSRVYCLNNNDFIQITTDHTLVEDLLKSGEISVEEANVHPKKNILTNALGVWENVKIDIDKYNKDADSFLICSDGLYGYTDHNKIKDVMLNRSLSTIRKVKQLLKIALDAGGYDNITMILIELEDEL